MRRFTREKMKTILNGAGIALENTGNNEHCCKN